MVWWLVCGTLAKLASLGGVVSDDNDGPVGRRLEVLAAWAGIIGALLAVLAFVGIGQYTDFFDDNTTVPTASASPSPTSVVPIESRQISREDYVRQVDGICARWFASINPDVDSSQVQNPQLWNGLISAYSAMIEEWEAVPVPSGDEIVIAQMLDAQKRDLDSFRGAARFALQGDFQAMQNAVQQGASDEAAQIDQVRRYGLETCG